MFEIVRSQVCLFLCSVFLLVGCTPSPEEVAEGGFDSMEQYRLLKKFGDTYYEALNNPDLITPEELSGCESNNYSRCEDEPAIFSVVLRSISGDGINLDIRNLDCSDGVSGSVDIVSIASDVREDYGETQKAIFEKYKGACMTLLLEIGEENWATPDVSVLGVVSIEPEENTEARRAGFESLEVYREFTHSDFLDAKTFKLARAEGIATRHAWNAKKEADKLAVKEKYGCVPYIRLSYVCDYDPAQRVRTQHYCFAISYEDAKDRTLGMCEQGLYEFRSGGGGSIRNVY